MQEGNKSLCMFSTRKIFFSSLFDIHFVERANNQCVLKDPDRNYGWVEGRVRSETALRGLQLAPFSVPSDPTLTIKILNLK